MTILQCIVEYRNVVVNDYYIGNEGYDKIVPSFTWQNKYSPMSYFHLMSF